MKRKALRFIFSLACLTAFVRGVNASTYFDVLPPPLGEYLQGRLIG